MHIARSMGRGRRPGSFVRCGTGSVLALISTCLLSLAVTQTAGGEPVANTADTGFAMPFAGSPAYEQLAPTQMTNRNELNQPLGQAQADALAARIGLGRADALTPQQYHDMTTGGGVGGDRQAADVINACVQILTNTVGRPINSQVNGKNTQSVLASYGLYVNPAGLLESPANADAPTRQVNRLLTPGGYIGDWLRNNGAARSQMALYRSGYSTQAPYGFVAQQMSGSAQLVTNTMGNAQSQVGISMAPPLWMVNFALIYVLNPTLAAQMPAHWAPIPTQVADAIKANPNGQVPFGDYASYFR